MDKLLLLLLAESGGEREGREEECGERTSSNEEEEQEMEKELRAEDEEVAGLPLDEREEWGAHSKVDIDMGVAQPTSS